MCVGVIVTINFIFYAPFEVKAVYFPRATIWMGCYLILVSKYVFFLLALVFSTCIFKVYY